MLAHPDLIQTAAQVEKLAEALRKHSIIAFDTEFIRETTFFPVVEIIQVATRDESWLVDAQAFRRGKNGAPGNSEALRPLLDVFEDTKILKIIHAAQGDQECIATAFGVVAKPSFDTAIGASLCGYGDGVGLGNLVKSVLGIQIKKGHARTNWSVRPLPAQLIEYAHVDVEHLVELGERLMKELDGLGRRDWALELTSKYEDMKLYEPDPDGLAQKLAKGGKLDKRGYAALLELMKWREDRVRQLNLPRRWVADDAVLVDLANVRPKDVNHLGAFRGLNKGELKNSGEAILAALKRASEMGEVAVPRSPRPDIPSPSESQVLDLLKCYVGILADEHKIAAKHLVLSAQLLPLLRTQAKDAGELAKQGLLSEGASRLVGDEILAFLHGRRALSVVSEKGRSRVQIVDSPSH